jgi:sialate O-acetylesterase
MNFTVFTTCVALFAPLATAEISLPSVLSDHMVLQQGSHVPIWGHGEPGETVVVRFADQTHTAQANVHGAWSISLDPMVASAESRTLFIDGSDTIEIADVLVGEVWICGGQSNMEWTIDRSEDPARERADANRPTIRLIKAPHVTASSPADTIDAVWTLCTPETVGGFTAIGFTFGRDLQDALDVPIGLLSINWGGTRIEPWISRASLAHHPRSHDHMEALGTKQDEWRNLKPEDVERKQAELRAAHARNTASYLDRQLATDPGASEQWFKPTLDTSSWQRTALPREWHTIDASLKDFDGGVWFRKTIDLPASFMGATLALSLGAIDDSDIVWFNGVRVGSLAEAHSIPRSYTIKGPIVKGATASIVVLAIDSGGVGGLTGPAAAMNLNRADDKGTNATAISLSGEWLWKQGSAHNGNRPGAAPALQEPGRSPRDYAAMYNGMISAFAPYGVRGAIWYQGESNANEPAAYTDFMPLLIRDWATTFQRDPFPFGIVQLAAFRPYVETKPAQGEWALLRRAQSDAAKTVDDVGLIVTTDIGDANDIHPKRKREVGRRLSLWARSQVYDQPVDSYSGPVVRHVTFSPTDDHGSVVVTFDHADGGLATRDNAPLGGFAVSSETNGTFHWAKATITGPDEVTLSCPDVLNPTAVCYAWQNNPATATLINGFGLPADGFQISEPESLP